MATVAGFTTADIHDAATLAGDGGTVIFPNGEYCSDSLKVLFARQTWLLDRDVVIKRSNTTLDNIISVEADGWRLRGGVLDGNRYVNPNLANGISAFGFSLDMRDFDLHSVSHWGISHADGDMILRDFSIRKTGQAAVFWRVQPTGVSRQGPDIQDGYISRQEPSDYTDSGCIAIVGQPTKRAKAPYVRHVRMVCCSGLEYNAGGVGIFAADRPKVVDCEVLGGRIGVSFGDCDSGTVQGNSVNDCTSYGIELAGNSTDNSVSGNPLFNCGTGPATTERAGVRVSGSSSRNRITDNPNHACPTPVRISSTTYGNVEWGN